MESPGVRMGGGFPAAGWTMPSRCGTRPQKLVYRPCMTLITSTPPSSASSGVPMESCWLLSAGGTGVGREHGHPLMGRSWAANHDPPGGVELIREATGQLRLQWHPHPLQVHPRAPPAPPPTASP